MVFVVLQQDPAMVEQLSKNITRQGLTNYTLNFLRVRWAILVYLLPVLRFSTGDVGCALAEYFDYHDLYDSVTEATHNAPVNHNIVKADRNPHSWLKTYTVKAEIYAGMNLRR
jgi:hypothetical protein